MPNVFHPVNLLVGLLRSQTSEVPDGDINVAYDGHVVPSVTSSGPTNCNNFLALTHLGNSPGNKLEDFLSSESNYNNDNSDNHNDNVWSMDRIMKSLAKINTVSNSDSTSEIVPAELQEPDPAKYAICKKACELSEPGIEKLCEIGCTKIFKKSSDECDKAVCPMVASKEQKICGEFCDKEFGPPNVPGQKSIENAMEHEWKDEVAKSTMLSRAAGRSSDLFNNDYEPNPTKYKICETACQVSAAPAEKVCEIGCTKFFKKSSDECEKTVCPPLVHGEQVECDKLCKSHWGPSSKSSDSTTNSNKNLHNELKYVWKRNVYEKMPSEVQSYNGESLSQLSESSIPLAPNPALLKLCKKGCDMSAKPLEQVCEKVCEKLEDTKDCEGKICLVAVNEEQVICDDFCNKEFGPTEISELKDLVKLSVSNNAIDTVTAYINTNSNTKKLNSESESAPNPEKYLLCQKACEISGPALTKVCDAGCEKIFHSHQALEQKCEQTGCPILVNKEQAKCNDFCKKEWGPSGGNTNTNPIVKFNPDPEKFKLCESACKASANPAERVCEYGCGRFFDGNDCEQIVCPKLVQQEQVLCDEVCQSHWGPKISETNLDSNADDTSDDNDHSTKNQKSIESDSDSESKLRQLVKSQFQFDKQNDSNQCQQMCDNAAGAVYGGCILKCIFNKDNLDKNTNSLSISEDSEDSDATASSEERCIKGKCLNIRNKFFNWCKDKACKKESFNLNSNSKFNGESETNYYSDSVLESSSSDSSGSNPSNFMMKYTTV